MDYVWLRSMWKDGGTTRDDMIEILISLALLKLKSRLWSINIFLRQCYLKLWFVTPFDDGPMTDTLWWLSMLWGFIISLVNVKLLISISYSLSKVFCWDFLIMTRNVEISKSCLVRDKLGGESWDQLLVNWFAHRGRHRDPPLSSFLFSSKRTHVSDIFSIASSFIWNFLFKIEWPPSLHVSKLFNFGNILDKWVRSCSYRKRTPNPWL